MRKTTTVASASVAAVLAVVLGATGAAASVSRVGTTTCPYFMTGHLRSATNGVTSHTWVDLDTGAAQYSSWSIGGSHESAGYAHGHWVIVAGSSILGSSQTCK
jgi:hypothetical protein